MEINKIRNELLNLPDLIEEVELEFLEAKYLYDYMSELKKHLLAKLKINKDGSNANKETEALASDEYRVHIDGMRDQGSILAKAAARFHSLERKFDSMRSLNKNV
jgi:hypothetical protein